MWRQNYAAPSRRTYRPTTQERGGMSLFPWNRSPYDRVEPDSLELIVQPGGALVDREWVVIERQRCAQQEETLRERAQEREAAARAATAEDEAKTTAQHETLKRELLQDLRDGGIIPS